MSFRTTQRDAEQRNLPRPGNATRDAGTAPEREFAYIKISVSNPRFPTSVGRLPVKACSKSHKVLKLTSCPNWVGMVPLMQPSGLTLTSSHLPLGVARKSVLAILKSVRAINWPSSDGRVPVKALAEMSNAKRDGGNWPKVAGS